LTIGETLVRASQIIFIDFDKESAKGDKDIFNPTDKSKKLATLKGGGELAFDVTKIGYDAADADAVKDAIVNQVKADFPAMTGLEFKNSKDHDLSDFAGQMVTVLDVVSGKTQFMFEVEIDGMKQTITFNDAGGVSQKIDTENMDKKDSGWILADKHKIFAEKEKNRIEIANTVSHELGHLLGLEHKHGSAGSIMGPGNDGTDRDFKKQETDVLKKAMCYEAPMQKQQKSKRLRWGDFDFAGTVDRLTPGTVANAVSTPSEKLDAATDMLAYSVAPDTRFKQLATDWTLAEPDDGLGTDSLVSGQLVRLPLPSNMLMDPFLTRSIFVEIGHYNVVDDPLSTADDIHASLVITPGGGAPTTMPLPDIFTGLDGGGGDGADPTMGLYDETAFQITDPSLFALISQAVFSGGQVEILINVPSSQTIGIDYGGLEVLFVPEPSGIALACIAAVAISRSHSRPRSAR
jgi:hypothetical protein